MSPKYRLSFTTENRIDFFHDYDDIRAGFFQISRHDDGTRTIFFPHKGSMSIDYDGYGNVKYCGWGGDVKKLLIDTEKAYNMLKQGFEEYKPEPGEEPAEEEKALLEEALNILKERENVRKYLAGLIETSRNKIKEEEAAIKRYQNLMSEYFPALE